MSATLPRHELERLFAVATGLARSEMVGGIVLDEPTQNRLDRLVEQRRTGVPLQYLEGSVQFGPIEIAVDQRALIPRPETEGLYELAIGLLEDIKAPVVVDLCTGSGNLALAIKHTRIDATVHACDVSPDATGLARENAAALDLDVAVHLGDLFDALPAEMRGRIDLLVGNPPYVSETEYQDLPVEIRDHEPELALVAGGDGLVVLEAISAEIGYWLGPRGRFALEIGESQSEAVRRLFAGFGPTIEKDMAGRNRYVVGSRRAA